MKVNVTVAMAILSLVKLGDLILSETTLLGIITAGPLTSRENVVRLKDGEFTRNPPHFAGHYFINIHFNHPTGDNYWRVYLRPGKMWFVKNMAKLSRTRHFIPVIIIPSKVGDLIFIKLAVFLTANLTSA